MLLHRELSSLVDRINSEEVERIFLSVPYATHLTGDDEHLSLDYYLRHRIETVKRIQYTAKTDAIALVQMIDIDYDAARAWSEYVAEELDHDRLYLRDLLHHGITCDEVAAIPPLASTLRMMDYMHGELTRTGPLTAVAYSLFTEWNSARGSAVVVAKAERQFSHDHVAGSKAHIGIDNDKDHFQIMVGVAHRLLTKRGTEADLERLLRAFAAHLGAYFEELYGTTIRADDGVSVAPNNSEYGEDFP